MIEAEQIQQRQDTKLAQDRAWKRELEAALPVLEQAAEITEKTEKLRREQRALQARYAKTARPISRITAAAGRFVSWSCRCGGILTLLLWIAYLLSDNGARHMMLREVGIPAAVLLSLVCGGLGVQRGLREVSRLQAVRQEVLALYAWEAARCCEAMELLLVSPEGRRALDVVPREYFYPAAVRWCLEFVPEDRGPWETYRSRQGKSAEEVTQAQQTLEMWDMYDGYIQAKKER